MLRTTLPAEHQLVRGKIPGATLKLPARSCGEHGKDTDRESLKQTFFLGQPGADFDHS